MDRSAGPELRPDLDRGAGVPVRAILTAIGLVFAAALTFLLVYETRRVLIWLQARISWCRRWLAPWWSSCPWSSFWVASSRCSRCNLLISLICGSLTYVVLKIAGVPFAGLIALFVVIADLIPLADATLGALIAGIVGGRSAQRTVEGHGTLGIPASG